MVRVVLLFSGSAASSLATEITLEIDVIDEVVLLSFRSPFFENYDRVKEIANRNWPELVFRSKSIKKETEDIGNLGCEMDGDGKPSSFCVSCRKSMLESGRNFLQQVGGDFLVTGEILGNHGVGLRQIKRIDIGAGVSGLVLRPLSSALLPVTVPEDRGWVESGYDLTASSSERLETLLDEYGLSQDGYFTAESRCKLTRSRYRKRLEDLLQEPDFNANDLRLLDFDYYYKLRPDTKIVLGVGSEEKHELHDYFLPKDLRIYLPCHEGPMALVRSRWDSKTDGQIERIVELAARITVANSEVSEGREIPVNYRFEHDEGTHRRSVRSIEQGDIEGFLI
ncbi:hypothetical protein KGY64_01855 [Candidatus Bipolaricaulota bacterium]|nr:hypothetical protein [Candidatus Bipolaricaulota bacterium]